jgi:hypothetical protein
MGFDQPVHFGEKIRNPLNLVDDDPVSVAAWNEAFEALRVRHELRMKLGLKEVDIHSPRECPADPRGLARAARAEEKETLGFWWFE